jgi:hypothetical protein
MSKREAAARELSRAAKKGRAMKSARSIGIAIIALGLLGGSALAADHADGPRAAGDPSADITDVFAWMSPDASHVNLVMALTRNASASSRFSDAVRYVFHSTSATEYGAAPSEELDIACVFDKKQKIHCRVDGDPLLRVQGDASAENGITSADGRLRVFAGLRDDAFFFNLAGFRATARLVTAAAGSLTFDPAGCPALDAPTSAALVGQLMAAPGGGPAIDNFSLFNVLAIVVSIDKSALTHGGPIVAAWGSTERRSAGRTGNDEDPLVRHVGAQIDRMGRPGVNTALTNPFYRESVPSELAAHEGVVDGYNASSNPAEWQGSFASEIATNLAILDSLDTVCGNQLLAGPSPVAGRYATLASVLADDRLYVNTGSGSCAQYLAVEADAVGIENDDCGGRTPLEDTIDTTYSLLAVGALAGVTDGVPVDADGGASLSVFPYLADPN